MRREGIKHSKSSWPKVIARKWFNIKSGTDEVHSINEHDNIGRVRLEPDFTVERNPLKLRMFVGTWNVGGKPPDQDLKLSHWLRTPTPVDIYVIGFQEIVPLNAGNVLGTEDTSSAAKWLSLIHQTLNTQSFHSQLPDYKNCYPTNPLVPLSPQNDQLKQQILKPRVSFSDLLSLDDEGDFLNRCLCLNPNTSWNSSNTYGNYGSPTSMSSMRHISRIQDQFSLVASKQMVGLFLCVWVRSDLNDHISNVKASCIGRGIMGYLGNKGSISISLTLCRTTFCFICTHLASGEKEGDEVKRNVDVAEILKKTKFSHSCRGPGEPLPPDTIMGHEVIWLGDLNYRLTSTCGDTNELIKNNDWQALLEKDQLKIEQRAGRVFKGWNEGRIVFAPTYKYVADSDDYVVQTSMPKEKRRIPAWCDRILWKGDGLKQICYVRGESKFSDHRPVYSLFSVDVNAPKSINTLSSPTCDPKIQAGEFTSLSRKTQSCIESIPRFSVATPKVTAQQ